MAEFPALPFFTDAFIADTTHLTASQTGAYLMLLFSAWRSPDCKLPNDDRILARMARMDGRAWVANKEVIMAFWKQDEQQKWYQRRLLDERKHVEDVRRKNADAGRASALKRKGRHSTDVQPEVNQTSTPTTLPTPSRKKVTDVTQEKPWDVTQKSWDEWMKVRKEKRLTMTSEVVPRMRKECAQLDWELQMAVDECNYRSWGGFKAAWILKERAENENTGANFGGHGKADPGYSRGGSETPGEAGKAIAINERIKADRLKNYGQPAPPERAGGLADANLRIAQEVRGEG